MERMVQLGNDIVKLWSTYGGSYLRGMLDTLLLALVATAIGCLIGLCCGILNTIPCEQEDPLLKRFFLKLIRAVVRIYVEVFRGTPMILQAVFCYYGLPYLTDGAMQFNSVWAASILVVSINTGAYMAEILRSGIQSVDVGQTEAARSIGMTSAQTMLHVVLPQGINNAFPAIGNEFVVNIKDSSVLNAISVTELFFQHLLPCDISGNPGQPVQHLTCHGIPRRHGTVIGFLCPHNKLFRIVGVQIEASPLAVEELLQHGLCQEGRAA